MGQGISVEEAASRCITKCTSEEMILLGKKLGPLLEPRDQTVSTELWLSLGGCTGRISQCTTLAFVACVRMNFRCFFADTSTLRLCWKAHGNLPLQSLELCARLCREVDGCRFFIYGHGKKEGQCYWELSDCNSFEEDSDAAYSLARCGYIWPHQGWIAARAQTG